MSTGDAIAFLVTFALFITLSLAAVVWVMDRTRRDMPHNKDEEDPDDPRD